MTQEIIGSEPSIIGIKTIFEKELSILVENLESISRENLDKILIKEQQGEPLTKREVNNKRVYEVNSRAIAILLKNLDAIIAIEATCENLIPLYQRNFEENKTDPIWLNRAASRMSSKDCSNDPLFVIIIESHN